MHIGILHLLEDYLQMDTPINGEVYVQTIVRIPWPIAPAIMYIDCCICINKKGPFQYLEDLL